MSEQSSPRVDILTPITPELEAAIGETRAHRSDAENETVDNFIGAYSSMAQEIQRAVDEGREIETRYETIRWHNGVPRTKEQLCVKDFESDPGVQPKYARDYHDARNAVFYPLLKASVRNTDFDLFLSIAHSTQDPSIARWFLCEISQSPEDVSVPQWIIGMTDYEALKEVAHTKARRQWLANLHTAIRSYATHQTNLEAKRRYENGEIGAIKLAFSGISTLLETGTDEKAAKVFVDPLVQITNQPVVERQILDQARRRAHPNLDVATN